MILLLDLLTHFSERAVGALEFLAALAVVAVNDESEAVPDYHDVLVPDRNVLPLRKILELVFLIFCVFLDNETQVLGSLLRSLRRRKIENGIVRRAFRLDLVCCSRLFNLLVVT